MILNDTPIRTTNNFKINNIDIDLEYTKTDFNDYILDEDNLVVKKEILTNFNSRIGLNEDKYLNLDITPKKEIDNLIINYTFDDNSYLTSNITINMDYDMNAIICFNSNKKSFLNFKLNINSKENIKSNISVITLTSDDSTNLVSIESNSNNNTEININYIDLLGSVRISNLYSNMYKENSIFKFNNIYFGSKDEKLDMNYYVKNNNRNTNSNMMFRGALKDHSKKTLRGTIDFISGSKESKGEENENCILLSSDAISKSLPMLLCQEENVEGSHGMSTGSIDKEKLFYLTSRGLDEKEAKKLIIKSNFNTILDNIFDDTIKNTILKVIDEKIDV